MPESAGRGDERRPDRNRRPGPSSAAAVDDSFSELRALLVGPEQRELLELQSHLRDPSVQTHDVSRVLPDAIALGSSDPRLSRALAPLIEDGITASVRKDPRPLADALFPVIGPAIRKAVGHTLAAMMDSFSRSIEQSLSWRALQWRWLAWKSGKPFGEIVLLNTLEYRVEQVFLIHAETGLLLQHVARDRGTSQDADQVSAMLTAIQDFVRDSFKVSAGGSLDALRVGDLTVFVERGPHAVLAGVVRGTAPPSVRRMFEDALEAAHRQLAPELRSFRGDATPFERARAILEACLVTQLRESQASRSRRPWLLAMAIAVIVAGVWLFSSVRDRQQWNAYVDRVRAQPGIVVLSSGRRGGTFVIAGLRDPLAADPVALISSSGLRPDRVESRWEPYQALHAPFVTSRAMDLLRPPAGVTLNYRDGLLAASGPAPARWIAESERIAPALAGVRRFEYAGRDPQLVLKERLEAVPVLFLKGTSAFAPGQATALRTIAEVLNDVNETARVRGRRVQVEILGHTDSDGSDVLNGPLSEARAGVLLTAIPTSRLDALEFTTRGVASTEPITAGVTEQEKQRNRRASIRLLWPGAESPQPSHRP
jgi:OOP family OmpA-OmpF porin